MRKVTARSSDLFRSQEAERILLCETVNSCWQWTRSKHHVRVPKLCGSYYLVNNSVQSCSHTMSVTLNLGAVGIIQAASNRAHILYQPIIFTSLLTELFDFFKNAETYGQNCIKFNPPSLCPFLNNVEFSSLKAKTLCMCWGGGGGWTFKNVFEALLPCLWKKTGTFFNTKRVDMSNFSRFGATWKIATK